MLGVKNAALPASLRRTNQRTVISLLLRLGCASRADLAKAAGISQPTAGKITAELLELGILQEVDGTAGNGHWQTLPRLGRPGQLLRLDDRRPRFLAIELGVAETNLSALPVALRMEDHWAISFPTPQTPQAWLRELKKVAPRLKSPSLWGALLSVPGIVDERAGQALFSPNLHWLEKINLPEVLEPLWEVPVLVCQEIRALAVGHLTAERGGEDFFLVDFGQGVGGAIVLQGKLYSQPKPLSGEFGHTPVPGNKRCCGCGAVGCLETLVSERGLLESFRRAAAPAAHKAGWDALVRDVSTRGLQPWLIETLDATARVISAALNVLGLHRVVVTGRLTELPGAIEHLRVQLKAGAMWGRFGEVACEGAPHRRAAGLVALGLDRLVLPAEGERKTTWRRQATTEAGAA